MKFLVDQPLAGLARWLRLCGFDAAVINFSLRKTLPSPAPETYLITRQAGFHQRQREDLLVLAANNPEGQVAEVFRLLKLSRRDLAPLSRCGECNDLLVPVRREAALGLVPDHVYHTQATFFQCPSCKRLYWPGSHPARIIARIQEAIADPPASVLCQNGRSESADSDKA
jgi:uncharacterized protein with PIN domain|uniref:Mut7-C RNAse domain-containing protein n=1 Tax=Desulfobacca acetoxidans TaxID=60893 RepID=A0A7V6DPQ3_9BACT